MKTAAALLSVTLFITPAAAAPVPFEPLRSNDYQSFVANWDDDDDAPAPLCRVIASAADWNSVMHAAAGMGRPRHPYAPPASYWATHVVFLIARVGTPPDDEAAFDTVLQVTGVDRQGQTVNVATRYTPPPETDQKVKFWAAASVRRPVAAGQAIFTDGGRTVCTATIGGLRR